MNITRKQALAMAAIVLAGVAIAVVVLFRDGHSDHAHGEAAHVETTPGAIRIASDAATAAGITTTTAGPARLVPSTAFPGEIRLDEERTAHVVPRVAGVAEAVPARLGQVVRKGDVLAVIASTTLADQRSELLAAQKRRDLARATWTREKRLRDERISAEQDFQQATVVLEEADIAVANAREKLAAIGAAPRTAALNRYEVRAPFDGTVVERHLTPGEAVREDGRVFTLSDLRNVWVEFVVAAKDIGAVREGDAAAIGSTAVDGTTTGRVAYVGALLGEQTRTARARVTLADAAGTWRPGLFVTVSVAGEARDVPVAVRHDAVQTIEDRPHVFVATADGFVARPVRLGRRDARAIEVVEGLAAGERIADANTFVLRSELGKQSADHGH